MIRQRHDYESISLVAGAEIDVRKEAAWTISNLTSGGSPEQIEAVIDAGAVPPLSDMLELEDRRIVLVALEGLHNMLKATQNGSNREARRELFADHLDKFEEASHHMAGEVANRAQNLLEDYGNFFEAEDDGSDDITDGGRDAGALAGDEGRGSDGGGAEGPAEAGS